jgi:hypothetical protein
MYYFEIAVRDVPVGIMSEVEFEKLKSELTSVVTAIKNFSPS